MIKAKCVSRCCLCGEQREFSVFDGKKWSTGVVLYAWRREHLHDWHPIEAKRLDDPEDDDFYGPESPSYYYRYVWIDRDEKEIESSRMINFYEIGDRPPENVSEPYVVERKREPIAFNEFTEIARNGMLFPNSNSYIRRSKGNE